MSIEQYNAEGYHDPTAYAALSHVEREEKKTAHRPLVFICSPFAGDMEGNTRRAREYSRFAVSKDYIPIAPHLLFPQFLDDTDPAQRELGISFGLVLQGMCREMWVFGDTVSKGMAVEIEKAKERGIPIRYFTDHCVEVRR